jgi:hypothetical protein
MKFVLLAASLAVILCVSGRSFPFPGESNGLGWGNEEQKFDGDAQWFRAPAADSQEEWPTEDRFQGREMEEPQWDMDNRLQNKFQIEQQQRLAQQLASAQRMTQSVPQGGFADMSEEDDEPSMLGRENEVEFQRNQLAEKYAGFQDNFWSNNEANQNDLDQGGVNIQEDQGPDTNKEFSPDDIMIQFFNSPGDPDDATLQELDWNDRDFLKEEYAKGLIQETWDNAHTSWDELMEQMSESDQEQDEPATFNEDDSNRVPNAGPNSLPVQTRLEYQSRGKLGVNQNEPWIQKKQGDGFRYDDVNEQNMWQQENGPRNDDDLLVRKQGGWEQVRFMSDDMGEQLMQKQPDEANEQDMWQQESDDDLVREQGGWDQVGFMSDDMGEQGMQEPDEVNQQGMWQQENGFNVNEERARQQMENGFRDRDSNEQRMWGEGNRFSEEQQVGRFDTDEREMQQQDDINKRGIWQQDNGHTKQDGFVNEQDIWQQENGFNDNKQGAWQEWGSPGFRDNVDMQELLKQESELRASAKDKDPCQDVAGERERVNCDIKNAEKRMIELEAKLEELEKKQTEQANLTECEIGESMLFPSPYCPV